LAKQDLAACEEGECLRLSALNALDSDRIDNLIRYWFSMKGVRMPSTAWLAEMRLQLSSESEDAQIRVTHPDCEIRRYRGRIYLTPRLDGNSGGNSSIGFRWNGEVCIEFLPFKGRLHFHQVDKGAGIDADWLRAQQLSLHGRRGGERLKAAPGRPTRSLKHHYQTLHIPSWERSFLPLVSNASHQLIFAAGIGLNWRDLPVGNIELRWEKIADCAR
jgi:tRNA(Ile)-lysidine synthase